RRFTVRFRCLLDNTSGFITLELSGRLQFLHGQSRGKQSGSSLSGAHMIHTASGVRSISKPSSSALAAAACQYSLPPLGLFVVCSPLGPLPSLNGSQRDMTFKTKHQLDLTVTTIDSRTRMLFSYTDADLQQFKVYDLVHPEDLRYVAQGHREVFRTGSVGLLVHRWISKSCEWIWLQSRVKLMVKNGKQDHIIVIHRQLSEQEGMELLIRRSDEYKLPFPLLEPETLLSEENLSSVGTGITDYNGPFAVSHLKDFDAGFLGSIINGGDRSGGCMHSLQKTNIASLSDNEVSHGVGPKRAFQQSSSFSRFTELLAITKDYPTSSRPSIRSPLPFSSQVIRHSTHTSKQTRQQMKDGCHNSRRKKNSAKEVAIPEAIHHPYGYSGIQGSLALSPALRLPTDEYSGNLYKESYLKPDACPFDSPLRNSGVMGQFSIPNHGLSTTLSDFNYSGHQLGLRTSGQYSTSPSNSLTQYAHHQQSFGLPDTFTRTVPLASPSGQEVRRDFGVQNFADSYTHYSGSYDAYSAAMAAAAMVAAASSYHPQHHNPNTQFAQLPSQLSIQPEPSFYADYIVPRLYQGSSQEVSCPEVLDTQEEIGLQRHPNRERCSPTLLMMNLRNVNNVPEGETLTDSYQEIGQNVDRLKQFSTVDTTGAFQRHGVIDGVRKVGYSGKVGELCREYGVSLLESDRLSRAESSELDLRTFKGQLEAGSVFHFSKQPTEIYSASTDFRRDTSLAGTVNLAPDAYKSFQAQTTASGESRTQKEQRVERSDKFTRKLEEYQTGTWRQQSQVSTTVGSLEVNDPGISVGDFEEQSSLKEGFQTGDNKSTSSLCSSSSSQMHSPVNQSQVDATHTKTQGTMLHTLSTITTQSSRDNHFWECKKQQSKSCIREQLTFNGTQFLPQSGTSTQHFSEADSLVTRQQYSAGNEFRFLTTLRQPTTAFSLTKSYQLIPETDSGLLRTAFMQSAGEHHADHTLLADLNTGATSQHVLLNFILEFRTKLQFTRSRQFTHYFDYADEQLPTFFCLELKQNNSSHDLLRKNLREILLRILRDTNRFANHFGFRTPNDCYPYGFWVPNFKATHYVTAAHPCLPLIPSISVELANENVNRRVHGAWCIYVNKALHKEQSSHTVCVSGKQDEDEIVKVGCIVGLLRKREADKVKSPNEYRRTKRKRLYEGHLCKVWNETTTNTAIFTQLPSFVDLCFTGIHYEFVHHRLSITVVLSTGMMKFTYQFLSPKFHESAYTDKMFRLRCLKLTNLVANFFITSSANEPTATRSVCSRPTEVDIRLIQLSIPRIPILNSMLIRATSQNKTNTSKTICEKDRTAVHSIIVFREQLSWPPSAQRWKNPVGLNETWRPARHQQQKFWNLRVNTEDLTMHEEEERRLLEKFQRMDKDNSGSLSRKEVKQCMKSCGFDTKFINEFIKTFDLDGDGQITLSEYQRVLNILPAHEKEMAMWRSVFNDVDVDKSGKISFAELQKLMVEMGYECQALDLKAWMSTQDLDKDGELNLDEFIRFIKSTP
ncbi:aryl hydrocarbon receptor, partial [Clonorchis sinensis]